ncbi:hypothetical protein GCK32_003130 [Trichostrongylus colubriformis]|uniref:Uncharacterized protein n=1 Tax=Trichostrongylus colubriformis TaxID=6319 RepID=A0AAN8GE57_TRICO
MILDYVQFPYALVQINVFCLITFHIYCKNGKSASAEQSEKTDYAAQNQAPKLNIRPPEQNRMMGTYDPNYQTLAGLNNDDVFKPKGGGGEAANVPANLNIRPPAENKMMGTYDPNYQTLAGLNNDEVFKPKGGIGGGPCGGGGGFDVGGGANPNIKPPPQNKMVGTYDPNYQTLAGLNNDDVFKRKVCTQVFLPIHISNH